MVLPGPQWVFVWRQATRRTEVCVCVGGTGSDGKQGHSHFLLWVPRSLNYACGGQRTAMITDAVYTAPWRSLLHHCRASFPSWH